MPLIPDVVSGQPIQATWGNAIRNQTVQVCTSTTRPPALTDGMMLFETDTGKLLLRKAGTLVDVVSGQDWIAHSPTISQGASSDIGKTLHYSKYFKTGKRIEWHFGIEITGAGAAAAGVRMTLPQTAAQIYGIHGSGYCYDASAATVYAGMWGGASTTLAALVGDWAANGSFGQNPNIALAAGDYLIGFLAYESAT